MTLIPQIYWLILAALLVLVLEFFSLGGYYLPRPLAIPLFGFLIIAVGHQTLIKGFQALAKLNFRSINLLMVIAVAGAIYLGQYEEAAVVIVLFNLAERLEDIGIAKSRSSLDQLVSQMPKNVLIKGENIPQDISSVKLDDIVLVKPGELLALDGEVVAGSSFVDESPITGEPLPQDKRVGDKVYAGSLNKQGALEIKVTQVAKDSTVAKIRELTIKALANKAETQKFIENFSRYYTPSIMLLAFGWTLLQWQLGNPFTYGFTEALSLLVIACPCALVISTPISIFSAIGAASSQGILIKGGRYLEAIAQIKALGIDKTRTLTFGVPNVTDVIPYGKHPRELILSCAAGIEQMSEHPLAQSIVNAAKNEKMKPHEVENFVSIIGKGAKADCLVCYDRHHCIGKLEFILEEHHVPEKIIREIEGLQNQGKTVIVISTHKEVEGIIALQDELRPESQAMISELKKLGIHCVMLTGDHPISAQAVARQIGIDEIKAELLPQDKLIAIKELIRIYGSAGMIGDGVNDAPALAASNVGISMSTLGSDTALEASSIVILNDHLEMIPYLVRLGRKTLAIIKANTIFALGIKFLVILLALAGMTNLAMAIFADVGVTLLVILNSLRLLNYSRT